MTAGFDISGSFVVVIVQLFDLDVSGVYRAPDKRGY